MRQGDRYEKDISISRAGQSHFTTPHLPFGVSVSPLAPGAPSEEFYGSDDQARLGQQQPDHPLQRLAPDLRQRQPQAAFGLGNLMT